MAGDLYLEDIHVGQRFAAGPVAVSAAAIKSFAAEFDPQPFHLDEAAAKTTLFKGLAASGWHTAVLTMRMLTEGGLPIATGVIGVGGEIAWPRTRCGPATNCVWTAKCSRSRRRAPNPVRPW